MSSLPSRAVPVFGAVTLLSLAISGCFSGSSSSSNSDSGPTPGPGAGPEWRTGVFVDSPVAGLTFRTESNDGVTDAQGTFRYQPGETVSFSLAGLELGEAPGEPVLSPLDIVEGAADSSHPAVINLSRLLQTLDEDGNLNNGIQLSEAIRAELKEFVAANPGFELPLDDADAFEAVLGDIVKHMNAANVFEEERVRRTRLAA